MNSNDERIGAILKAALNDPSRKWPRRHPCEVTADRLADHLDKYPDYFDGATCDDIGHLRHILQDIADASRVGHQ